MMNLIKDLIENLLDLKKREDLVSKPGIFKLKYYYPENIIVQPILVKNKTKRRRKFFTKKNCNWHPNNSRHPRHFKNG